MGVKLGILSACSVLALSIPAAALAQDGLAEDPGSLGDIIVTAQRRSESLQNVPIAITVANADTLAAARVENISNIQAISPSVSFRATNNSATTANLMIRGLGTIGNSRSFEGSVGVFIDGIYRTRAGAALQSFLDFDNVQVLRGPQGTLFGKNTTAGAILINSTAPSLQDRGGSFDFTYGNYDTLIARAAVNLPLSDKMAFRVAGIVSESEGFFTDATTRKSLDDTHTKAVKAQFLVEPSDTLSIRLIGDYSRNTGNCCYGTANFVNGPTQPLIDALTLAGGRALPSADISDREVSLNGNGRQLIKDYGGTLLIDAELGSGTLKSITGLRRFSVSQTDEDADFTGADLLRYEESFRSRFLSQEFTYQTKIPSLNADVVLGLFASDEKLDMRTAASWGPQGQTYWDILLSAAGIPPGTAIAGRGNIYNYKSRANSYAGFAHADFTLNDQLNLIAGLRYSVERKKGAFTLGYYDPPPFAVFTLLGISPGPNYDAVRTNKALSGTLVLQYRPNSDTMLYASYNRGFKAGGVNLDSNAAGLLINNTDYYNAIPAPIRQVFFGGAPAQAPLDPSYKPEVINAFEIGGKFKYLGGRARTNIALFYYDISNLQIAQFIGLRFTVLNAKSAVDYGVEIENLFHLTDALTLGVDATWLPHANYSKDSGIDPVLSGSRFRFAPKLTSNVTLNLDQPLNDNVNLTGRVQYQYSSSQLVNQASASGIGPVSLVNANLGLKFPHAGLQVEAFVQNLFDRTYFSNVFNTAVQSGDQNGYLAPPRTFGARLRAQF